MAAVRGGEKVCYSTSICPLCRMSFDVSLILPCSHTLCGRCLSEQCGGGVKGGATLTEGGAWGVTSKKWGGVDGVSSLSYADIKSMPSSDENEVKDMACLSRDASSSLWGEVKGGVSSSKGGVRNVYPHARSKGEISIPFEFRDVDSNSQLGVKGVASLLQSEAMGVSSVNLGGAKEVSSGFHSGVKEILCGFHAEELSVLRGDGVKCIYTEHQGGVNKVFQCRVKEVVSTQTEIAAPSTSPVAGVKNMDTSFKDETEKQSSLSHEEARDVSSARQGGVKCIAPDFQSGHKKEITLSVGGVNKGESSSEGGVKRMPYSSSHGGFRRETSSWEGRVRASFTEFGVKAEQFLHESMVKEKVSSSKSAVKFMFRGDDGVRDVASFTKCGVIGLPYYNAGIVKGELSPSKGGVKVKYLSSSHEGYRGVGSFDKEGVRDVASFTSSGVDGLPSIYVHGVKGEISLEGGIKNMSSSPHPVCTVFCPNCDHRVELPCFDWSSALTCLAYDPTVTLDPAVKWRHEERSWETDGSVDLSEEEMEQSVSGLVFTLDSSSCNWSLRLSGSALTVTMARPCDQGNLPEVCATVYICRGQYYWEVDVCNSTLYRIGVVSSHDGRGWWLERRGTTFHAVTDICSELLTSIPPNMKTVGVFLNVGGASITFHNAVTQECLAAVPAHFSTPLRPALQLGEGRLKVRPGIPPPNHVFLCRSSTYQRPRGAGPGRWRQDVRFSSVKDTIQKFEELQH